MPIGVVLERVCFLNLSFLCVGLYSFTQSRRGFFAEFAEILILFSLRTLPVFPSAPLRGIVFFHAENSQRVLYRVREDLLHSPNLHHFTIIQKKPSCILKFAIKTPYTDANYLLLAKNRQPWLIQ
jgi:hypothetical protein